MDDVFVRLVGSAAVDEYKECSTFEKKLNSKLVKKTLESVGVSVFNLSGITVERVVAAVTASRSSPGNASYLEFGSSVIVPEQTPGDTPDAGVNALHYEFRDLSESNLVDLADCMVEGRRGSMNSEQIRNACRDSIRAGHMETSAVKYDLGKW